MKRTILVLLLSIFLLASSLAQNPLSSVGVGKKASAGGGGGSAPSFRALSDLSFGTRTNSTLNKPTGTANNDILIAGVYITGTGTVTPPAGWTEYTGSPHNTNATWFDNIDLHLYWKRASSEGASWTWTHSSTGTFGMVAAFSGCTTSGDPNDVSATFNSTLTTSVTGTGVTTSTANTLGVMMWVPNNSVGTETPPAGWTERGTDPVGGNSYGLIDNALASTGATGNIVITIGTSQQTAAMVTALKP